MHPSGAPTWRPGRQQLQRQGDRGQAPTSSCQWFLPACDSLLVGTPWEGTGRGWDVLQQKRHMSSQVVSESHGRK